MNKEANPNPPADEGGFTATAGSAPRVQVVHEIPASKGKHYKGAGVIFRCDAADFIVVARNTDALKRLWAKLPMESPMDEGKCMNVIVVTAKCSWLNDQAEP